MKEIASPKRPEEGQRFIFEEDSRNLFPGHDDDWLSTERLGSGSVYADTCGPWQPRYVIWTLGKVPP